MNVLEYLFARAKKLAGEDVPDEKWNEVVRFEEEHPELVMQPSAIEISKKEGE